jgi:DNA-binding NtrC family response regulator
MTVLRLAETSHLYLIFSHVPQPPQRDEPEHEDQQSSPKIKRVMVIDDELLIAESLVDILRLEGYKAIAVSDGAAAVKWAEFLEPEAIICDVAMPRMDGFEVAKQVRALLPDCRIILFSGHVTVQKMLANMPIDGKDFEFVAKPVKPEVILKLLQGLKAN